MTTSGMSYGEKNGIQDQAKPKNLPKGLVPPNNVPCGNVEQSNLPNVLLCFRTPKAKKINEKEKRSPNAKKGSEKKRSKSCELRGGIFYSGCECEKRDGLQDQCPRTECRGSPTCLTNPPTCGPSEFAGAKHLTRKTDDYLKRKREAQGGKSGKPKTQTSPLKSEYDCFPLDVFLTDGGACPLCSRAMDTCAQISDKINLANKQFKKESDKPHDTKNSAYMDIAIGPIMIELPPDCPCP